MYKYPRLIFIVFILAAVILFFIITNLIWLSIDDLPPAWDQSHHMLLSLKYYKLIYQPLSLDSIKKFFSVSHYYPPFFHTSAIPLAYFLGFSEHNLIFVNLFYVILLVISLFKIGEILFNKHVGIFVAALTLFYPGMFTLSREYLIDFALVSMVTAVQLLILKSDGGLKRRWGILLGIAIGFALLTKPSSIIFILPLWIYICLINFNPSQKSQGFSPRDECKLFSAREGALAFRLKSSTKKKQGLFRLFIIIAIILFIAGPWYMVSFKDMLKSNNYWQHVSKTIEHDPQIFYLSFFWYRNALEYSLISSNLLLFFYIGLFSFFILDRRWKILLILAVWFIPAFLIFILIPNKDMRYIMPLLPVFSIITIGGIDAIAKKIIKNVLFLIIAIISFIQFMNLSFNLLPDLIKDKKSWIYYHVLSVQNWKYREILQYISDNVGNKNIIVGILPDCQYFNRPGFELYAQLLHLPYLIEGVGGSLVTFEQIEKYDIFITKYPRIADEHTAYYRIKFYNELREFGIDKLGFKLLREFWLPDGSTAALYQKI